jgi:hypothetical protein
MNELDIAITSVLRADAQEASMATDTARESEKLRIRLDELEQSHRRRAFVWSAVAAAAAVVMVVAGGFLLAGREDGQQPAVTPVPAGAHSDPYFSPTFTMSLPEWIVSHHVSAHENVTYSWWPFCEVVTTCSSLSVSRFDNLLVDGLGPKLTYDRYLQHLGDLATQGTISISGSIPRTVDGRRATEIDATSTTGAPLALGCAGTSCQDVQPDMAMRYVVVDMGSGQAPVVIFSETARANPDGADWMRQLDTVLTTIRFGVR